VPRGAGRYVLVLRLSADVRLRVGSLGEVRLRRGLYAYVGSATGPGGLERRVRRHISKAKRLRWHIDYLTSRPECAVEGVVLVSSEAQEADIVWALERAGASHPVEGFGSSDDPRSRSHLLYLGPDGGWRVVFRALSKLRRLGVRYRVVSPCGPFELSDT